MFNRNLIVALCFTTISCTQVKLDPETLHFTTEDGTKTSLDLQKEVYLVDDFPGIYYLNYLFYTKNSANQWSFSLKATGPWKIFPDSNMAPNILLLLTD